MTSKPAKPGRPRMPPTTTIAVPVDKITAVEKILGYKINSDQTPRLMVRIPVSMLRKINAVIKGRK